MQEQEQNLKYVLLSQDVFDELRDRYLDWYNAGMPTIDDGVRRAVELLNELPGLVTHYSCQGHISRLGGSWEGFNIVTGLTVEGLAHVRYLWGGLHKRLLEKSHEMPVFGMLPRFLKLEFQMLPNIGITSKLGPSDWVPMCVLQLHGAHPQVVEKPFGHMLQDTVESYYRDFKKEHP